MRKKLEECGFTKLAPNRTIISNSIPSQYLRTAAVQKIIASTLCTSIFKPYYLPEIPADRRQIDDVLERLGQSSPYEEAVFRLRLLSAYKNEETAHIERIVRSAVAHVSKLVDPLLTPATRKTFQSEIESLFKEAVDLWLPTRRSRTKVRVDNKPDFDWEFYEEYDTSIESDEEHKSYESIPDEPIDALFPRVYFGSTVLLEGYALWSCQKTVIAANIEQSKNRSQPIRRRTNSSNHGGTGPDDNRGRRPDLGNTTTPAGRQRDSRTSPKSPVMSFSDHANSRKAINS